MKKFLLCFLLFVGIFSISCDSPKKHWENAIEKFNNKEYVEAENILNNLIIKYPASEFVEKAKEKTAEIYWNRACESFNNKEFEETEIILNNLINKFPTSVFIGKAKDKIAEIYWNLAIDKFNDEYYEQAQNILNDLISKYPTSEFTDVAEKKIKEIKNKGKEFYTDFRLAYYTSNTPKIKRYLMKEKDKIVEAFIISGLAEELLAQNNTWLKFNKNSISYFYIGSIAFDIGDKETGYECFYKAIKSTNDNYTKIGLEVAFVNNLLEDNYKKQAIEHLKEAIEIFYNEIGEDKETATKKLREYIKSTTLSKKSIMLQLINEIDKEQYKKEQKNEQQIY